MKVLVVESPAKAKTINKYLGSDYHVVASFGHIRDLPPKDGSVNPDADFAMVWELEGRGAKQLSEIAKAVKGAEKLILATDPDREGEAISWHVLQALNEKKALRGMPVERVTFNAITRDTVTAALKAPREIDAALVDAYLARRALDYLVGFTLSPVLWRKLPGAKSAGRVQSVALRLVCDREREIEAFRAREYWTIVAELATLRGHAFEARLVGADGKKINRLDIGAGAEAEAFKAALQAASFEVASIEAKPVKRHPAPPFQTSALQQEASRKLGFAPARTMQLAQRLYEGVDIGGETVGLITYMRTDGVDMDGSAIAAARRVIGKEFGAGYVPEVPRKYTTKAKNAQEAHEAIRPTDMGRLPAHVARALEPDQARLYELIWMRTIASQMESAQLERTTVEIKARAGTRDLDLRATGQVVLFDGFLKVYQEGRDDEDDEESRRLPQMTTAENLRARDIRATQSFTEPPPRFSEASLVKRMEELGIGRPSTYASILQVLRDREYVSIDKKRLVPNDTGRVLSSFLESFFARYVEYDFTASLENDLDRISNHEVDWKEIMRAFWEEFSAAIAGAKDLRTGEVIDKLDEALGPHLFPARADGGDPRRCPTCGNGRLGLRFSKTGGFIGCSNYPECRYTRPMAAPSADGEASGEGGGQPGVRLLGKDPVSGLDVTVRDGRFGPYVQLGEGEKPKRQTLPKGVSPAHVELDRALVLLSLPREVARHPESGEPILAGIGRFGPYVQHGKTYANIGKDDDILEIGANRAIDLIVAKESGAGSARRFGGAPAGRLLGEYPEGGPITVRGGRYGAYVNWDKINATLPKPITEADVTLEQAIDLIRARIASGPAPKGGRKPSRAAKPAARSKPPAKPAGKSAAKSGVASADKKPAGKSAAKPASAARNARTTPGGS
ncbi:MAG: type I DNA topoisomerase [Bosea sp.]|jgi:DNA topoisomerase-1|nr:type I DNA topoisomerase [Bosea sp. (in: a-proteobacteria)]